MPELPEVETVRRELEPWLTGRRIVRARRADAPPGPKYAQLERADGQRIAAVARRGKFLILPLSSGDELIIHLGMTGVVSATVPAGHVRVTVDLSGARRRRLYFHDVRRFGRFLVLPEGNRALLPSLACMGPEPLSADFEVGAFCAALDSKSAIKTFLLSQRPVAGLGNIYCDEALWRARIHPLVPAHRVSRRKARALHGAIIGVLSASVAARGTTISDYRTVGGEAGSFMDQLAVYGRDQEPCPRCSRLLRKIVVGARGTHFCAYCQRPPRLGR